MHHVAHHQISCHCGETKRIVTSESQAQPLSLCHCRGCRHSSGLLCTSYFPIKEPLFLELQGLVPYQSRCAGASCTRWFCGKCGCHVYRTWEPDLGADGGKLPVGQQKGTQPVGSRGGRGGRRTGLIWEVATGVVGGVVDIDGVRDEDLAAGETLGGESRDQGGYARHLNVDETGDGGLARYIKEIDGRPMEVVESRTGSAHSPPLTGEAQSHPVEQDQQHLDASCACGAVRLHITRPDASSRLPRSDFPDLMTPYHSSSDPVAQNPKDEKWWLRPGGRYLAGTCACRSCRLGSGFEIQTWTFVPRSNILLCTDISEPGSGNREAEAPPLDFENLPEEVGDNLKTYDSSEGVQRNFCGSCGATLFWHDKWRPDVVDVSIGLLDAEEGSRAETWLEWWTERVSFTEDVGNARWGIVERRARALIRGLEEGFKEEVTVV